MINELGKVKLGAINENGNFEATLVEEITA